MPVLPYKLKDGIGTPFASRAGSHFHFDKLSASLRAGFQFVGQEVCLRVTKLVDLVICQSLYSNIFDAKSQLKDL